MQPRDFLEYHAAGGDAVQSGTVTAIHRSYSSLQKQIIFAYSTAGSRNTYYNNIMSKTQRH